MDLSSVLKTQFVHALVEKVCGKQTDLIERPACFVVRNQNENPPAVERVILLPPSGYTANALNQTNSHDEALRATIQVKGAVREGKQGFSKLKDCLLVVSFPDKKGVSDLNQPYLSYQLEKTPGLSQSFHSAGEAPFTVVKPNGFGFYHNLVNTRADWLVLHLKKELRPQRKPELDPHLISIPTEEATLLKSLYERIVSEGDGIFSGHAQLVEEVTRLNPQHSLPALGEMLFAYDTGRHEACSAFAVLLKVGKIHPKYTLDFLSHAQEQKDIPPYYTRQLMAKIQRTTGRDEGPSDP